MLLGASLIATLLANPDAVSARPVDATVSARDESDPASRAARRLLTLVESIDSTIVESAYQHRTIVRRREGVYLWDCSGMMNWMLERVAPRAREALDRDRPVAATYHRIIKRAPSRPSRAPWRRLPDIRQARPGDIFAWLRPPDWPKGGNTGHVGIIVERPRPVPEIENAWAVRILDASRYTHDDDTRDPEGAGGFGMGTILLITDEAGAPRAYGWFGTKSRRVNETSIVLGRITS